MRLWFFPLVAFLLAAVAIAIHVSHPVSEVPSEPPTRWASDHWTSWEKLDSLTAKNILGEVRIPPTSWVHRFSNEEGQVVWHAKEKWPSFPEWMDQKPWRGGWLMGLEADLAQWQDRPGAMAAKWKDSEVSCHLEKGEHGIVWSGDGWIVWMDGASSDVASQASFLLDVDGQTPEDVDMDWWAGPRGSAPWRWIENDVSFTLSEAEIPWASWSVRWENGGRFYLPDASLWRTDVEELAQRKGWSVSWEGNTLLVNPPLGARWTPSLQLLSAQIEGIQCEGTLVNAGLAVWSSVANAETLSSPFPVFGELRLETERDLGWVRNHRTKESMAIRWNDQGVQALDSKGGQVWQLPGSEPLTGGAKEVDVYANGKFQTMFCGADGLHLIDVKGREVKGFPIRPANGNWSSWALVDYDGTKEYRYLLASAASGLVENFRREGMPTPGWSHRPAAHIETQSAILHLAHLRLGRRDYIYVGRENGQVELLRRDGRTRASTSVQVNAASPPVFRVGADLDGTSVLYLGENGWVRERSLGLDQEVGLSGMVQADRIELLDVDGDGRDEIVTWLRGERSVWNARNERVK